MNDVTNVTRLVRAGLLDDKNLTEEGRNKINSIDLTEEELATLVEIKNKLELHPLQLESPSRAVGITDYRIWQL
jgi:hypothetical protein